LIPRRRLKRRLIRQKLKLNAAPQRSLTRKTNRNQISRRPKLSIRRIRHKIRIVRVIALHYPDNNRLSIQIARRRVDNLRIRRECPKSECCRTADG
jgi:hypothetical protein